MASKCSFPGSHISSPSSPPVLPRTEVHVEYLIFLSFFPMSSLLSALLRAASDTTFDPGLAFVLKALVFVVGTV